MPFLLSSLYKLADNSSTSNFTYPSSDATFEQLASSTFWLLGVFLSVCLFLLTLVAILVGRYRWRLRRLTIFYAAGSEGAFTTYAAQYLVRLSYERDPTMPVVIGKGRGKGGGVHSDDCQVLARIWYEDGPKDGLTVPMIINKIYQFNGKPSSVVLLRTPRPLTNLRSVAARLNCAEDCPMQRRAATLKAARSKSSSKEKSGQNAHSLLFTALQATSASLQAVPSRWSIATKVLIVGEPRSYFVLSGSAAKCPTLMEADRLYSLSIEYRQQIDYHPILGAITCPTDAVAIFNYAAASLTAFLVTAAEIRYQGTLESQSWLYLVMVLVTSIVGSAFLICGLYLFVTIFQERLLARSLGRSSGAWLLHCGLLFLLMVAGFVASLSAVTLVALAGQGGSLYQDGSGQSSDVLSANSSSPTSTSRPPQPLTSGQQYSTLLLVGLSWTGLAALEAVVCHLDDCFSCLGGVFSSFICCCCPPAVDESCPRLRPPLGTSSESESKRRAVGGVGKRGKRRCPKGSGSK